MVQYLMYIQCVYVYMCSVAHAHMHMLYGDQFSLRGARGCAAAGPALHLHLHTAYCILHITRARMPWPWPLPWRPARPPQAQHPASRFACCWRVG